MFASLGLALPRIRECQRRVGEGVERMRAAAAAGAERVPILASITACMTASLTASQQQQQIQQQQAGKDRCGKASSASASASFKLDKKGSKPKPSTGADLDAAFRRVDTDGNGHIDRGELQAACASLGLPSSDDYVDEVIRGYDVDGDKTISKKEFVGFIKQREQALWKAFQAIDVDKDGMLSQDEALKAVRQLGLKAEGRDAAQMIRLLDANHDGVVSYEEFRAYLSLLPAAQLRENVGWNWLAAASDRAVPAPASQPFKQLLAGALGGSISRTVVAPLDRAIFMIQAETGRLSLGSALQRVLQKEGPMGLWRGNTPNVIKVIPRSALQFAVYANMKDFFLLRKKPKADGSAPAGLTTPERLIAGGLAGATATVVTYPLDLIRSQMAVNGTKLVDTFKSVVKAAGPLGLYRGLTPTLGADIVGNALGFLLYDTYVDKYKMLTGKKAGSVERGVIGALSACTCLTITFPLEVVMTRMRVQGTGGRAILYKSVADCLVQIAQKEGVSALWKGALTTYIKVFPQVFVVYFTVASVNKALGVGGLRAYGEEGAAAAGTAATAASKKK